MITVEYDFEKERILILIGLELYVMPMFEE